MEIIHESDPKKQDVIKYDLREEDLSRTLPKITFNFAESRLDDYIVHY